MSREAVILMKSIEAVKSVMEDALDGCAVQIDSKELQKIVLQHSVVAAMSAGVAGSFPGVGAVVATGISGTAILAMYVRLAKALGVTFKKGALKALASGIVADLSATIVTNLVAIAVVSFVPGIGTATAATLSLALNFALVYLAAIIFLKMLSAILNAGEDISEMSEEELKNVADSVKEDIDMKSAIKEAKEEFKKNKDKKEEFAEDISISKEDIEQ